MAVGVRNVAGFGANYLGCQCIEQLLFICHAYICVIDPDRGFEFLVSVKDFKCLTTYLGATGMVEVDRRGHNVR